MKTLLAIITLLTFASFTHAEDRNCGLASPDGKVQLLLILNDERPTFTVTFNGHPVIEKATLGLTLDGVDLTSQTRGGVLPGGYDHNETYATRGVHSTATDRHNGWRMPLTYIPDKF